MLRSALANASRTFPGSLGRPTHSLISEVRPGRAHIGEARQGRQWPDRAASGLEWEARVVDAIARSQDRVAEGAPSFRGKRFQGGDGKDLPLVGSRVPGWQHQVNGFKLRPALRTCHLDHDVLIGNEKLSRDLFDLLEQGADDPGRVEYYLDSVPSRGVVAGELDRELESRVCCEQGPLR